MRPLCLILFALLLCGCASSTTETGYEPRHLGMSDGQRRGLYAPRYSIEQAQAAQEREQEAKRNRPQIGVGGPNY
jgi:hypothetical protein